LLLRAFDETKRKDQTIEDDTSSQNEDFKEVESRMRANQIFSFENFL
jgi:hypothetical protein